MLIDIDNMRLRAALDRAVQNSFARYLRATELAREEFEKADQAIWNRYDHWYSTAANTAARASVIAAYKDELYPWAAVYSRAVESADISRKRDKAKIDALLQEPDLETKIRLLAYL